MRRTGLVGPSPSSKVVAGPVSVLLIWLTGAVLKASLPVTTTASTPPSQPSWFCECELHELNSMHGIRPFPPFQNKGEEKDSLNLSQGANPPRSAAKTVLRLLPVNCANGHHGHTHGRTTHVCITVHQRFKKAMRLVQPMYDISHHPSFPLTRQGVHFWHQSAEEWHAPGTGAGERW